MAKWNDGERSHVFTTAADLSAIAKAYEFSGNIRIVLINLIGLIILIIRTVIVVISAKIKRGVQIERKLQIANLND